MILFDFSFPEKLEKYYDSIVDTSSIVHFYFKELGIVKYQKEQLYGALDILGNQMHVITILIHIRAGSVLPETEKPKVLMQILENRNRYGTEI